VCVGRCAQLTEWSIGESTELDAAWCCGVRIESTGDQRRRVVDGERIKNDQRYGDWQNTNTDTSRV
jgi:hypothetical protein